MKSERWMGIYEKLNITPLINARGNTTSLGGSLMEQEVLQAMCEASKYFIDLSDLLQNAGQYLSKLIGVDAAYISSGSAGGMVLAAAACILNGNRQEKKGGEKRSKIEKIEIFSQGDTPLRNNLRHYTAIYFFLKKREK